MEILDYICESHRRIFY